ncbi:hypothetical protein FOZ62_021481, partial [Perkinsus olseni]
MIDPDNMSFATMNKRYASPPTGGAVGSSYTTNNNNNATPQQQPPLAALAGRRGESLSVGLKGQSDGVISNNTRTPDDNADHQTTEGGRTLRTLLQELDKEDESCIFIVRRIHKFGFRSPVFLREYFEDYGEVRKVLVAHSKQLHSTTEDNNN